MTGSREHDSVHCVVVMHNCDYVQCNDKTTLYILEYIICCFENTSVYVQQHQTDYFEVIY